MRLTTERLWIDSLQEDDAPFFLKLLNTPGWLQFVGDRQVTDLGIAHSYIESKLTDPGYHCGVLRLQTNGCPIGTVSFIYRDNQEFPDIGYAMVPEAEGKGYAFEAVQQYLVYMVSKMQPSKVIAIVLPGNTRSVRPLERLGFGSEKIYTENGTEMALYARLFPANNPIFYF